MNMVLKIISGGQTGAERAALDFAIRMNIPHCGYIPMSKAPLTGPYRGRYNLQLMPTFSRIKSIEQNVIDSDGTLVISHRKVSVDVKYSLEMSVLHSKPHLHVVLHQKATSQVSQDIKRWIKDNNIEILNVTGPMATKDPNIYDAVMNILEKYYYSAIDDKSYDVVRGTMIPRTVEEAVEKLIANMPFRQKVIVAKMIEEDLIHLDFTVGAYIRDHFALWSGNQELFIDCIRCSGKSIYNLDEAVSVIIREFWKRLSEEYRLRKVK